MKRIKELSKNPNSKEFKKELYNYFVNENYNYHSLNSLVYETDIRLVDLKRYLEDYIYNELCMSKDEFDEFRKQEKEKNKEIYLGKTNKILLEEGIKSKFLYRNEVEKNIFLKGLYNKVLENDYDVDFCKNLAKEYKMTLYSLSSFIKDYVFNTLNIKKEELSENARFLLLMDKGESVRIINYGLRKVYRDIINSNNIDEIVNSIESSSYDYPYIYTNFRLYKKYYLENELVKIEEGLKEYSGIHKKNKKETGLLLKESKRKKKMELNKDTAVNLVTEYLNNTNLSYEEFLTTKNITKEKLNEYLEIVKTLDKNLYNKYIDSKNTKEEESKTNKENIVKLLEEGILNGYDENDMHREFDVLDYLIITKIPVTKMDCLDLYSIDRKARDYLHTIKRKYIYVDRESPQEYNDIMTTTRIVGVEFDEKRQVIPGTGREITDKERNGIIKFLNDNNIAVNRMTYNIALKRYINGFLVIKEPKKLTLNNQ